MQDLIVFALERGCAPGCMGACDQRDDTDCVALAQQPGESAGDFARRLGRRLASLLGGQRRVVGAVLAAGADGTKKACAARASSAHALAAAVAAGGGGVVEIVTGRAPLAAEHGIVALAEGLLAALPPTTRLRIRHADPAFRPIGSVRKAARRPGAGTLRFGQQRA